MAPFSFRKICFALIALSVLYVAPSGRAQSSAGSAPNPGIVLTAADRRPALSLNGEWSSIVDPYFSGLFSFHHQEKTNGWFLNRKAQPDDPFPTEYDYSKAPKLKVPGDWNTQRESLLYYEGPVWYERDFIYRPKAHTRILLHVGAANYRSWFWVNGAKVCEHEGGFTAFNCDATAAVHEGSNFIVAAVDNTRREDNVPTLETDWWNYGGLIREVSLIEVPEAFIDQYDLHLNTTEPTLIEGWVHVQGGQAGSRVEVEIPELRAKAEATVTDTGRAPVHLSVQSLQKWSPEDPKLYKVNLRAGADSLHTQRRTRKPCLDGPRNSDATLCAWRTILTPRPCCARPTARASWFGQRIRFIGPSSLRTPRFLPRQNSNWTRKSARCAITRRSFSGRWPMKLPITKRARSSSGPWLNARVLSIHRV